MNTASASQIKKIHALKSVLGLDEDLYREMLSGFSVQSSKKLTVIQAGSLIETLEAEAVARNVWQKKQPKYSNLERDDDMATPSQMRLIEGLWREICYIDTDKFAKTSLRKFLKSKFKIDDIMFLTKTKATKVINGIKNIKKNLKERVNTLSS